MKSTLLDKPAVAHPSSILACSLASKERYGAHVLMLIYCIRHGESCYNAEGRLQGQSHTPLSPLGLRQADAVAAALADKPIEAIYTSPLPRAAQTAAAVAGPHKLTPVTDPRLMEINVGLFQDLLHAEIADRYPAETALWR